MEDEDEVEGDGFVSIGSAFQYLETDDDIVKAKEKKEKELYVLDKQGRRRFHGAFTGGFSAGYFMSVGTKEGWSPAPFVSSRSQKASQPQQRPEDYMDDEDLDHFGIAPRQVSTKAMFTQEKLPELSQKRPAVIPGDPLLNQFIVPAKSTIGARLMKSMGWKEGKGVGPTSVDAKVKVYGCLLPGNSNMGPVEFAPNDISSWDFTAKNNLHGIGYSGMSREHFTNSQFSKGVYGMSGQAFGVGALEEDDDDIFTHDSIASYHNSLTLPTDKEQSNKYGWTGGKEMGDTWSLSSFERSSTRHNYTKVYPPPMVPRGFASFHKFPSTSSGPQIDEKPVTTATERGYVTGQSSVFDLVSSKDKERLKMAKERKQFNLESYQPFSYDPDKQSRYDAYLKGNRSRRHEASLTDWENEKEMKEFDRLAKVHKPLTTILSDRFTRGIEQETIEPVKPADVEMFGSMTHQVIDWYPHRVLCKRFNIPDPYPNSDTVGIPNSSSQPPSTSSINWRQNMSFEPSTTINPMATINNKQEEMETEATSQDITNEDLQEEEEEQGRPSVTLLKSIFAESSSEEENEEVGQLDKPHPPITDQLVGKPHTPITDQLVGKPHLPLTDQADRLHPAEQPEKNIEYSLTRNNAGPLLLNTTRTHLNEPKPYPIEPKPHPINHPGPHNKNSSRSRTNSEQRPVQHLTMSEGPKEKQWKNLAEMIKPTLSEPQKLEQPLVYVKESFGPALPPSLLLQDTKETNDVVASSRIPDCEDVQEQQYHDGNSRVHEKDKHRHKTKRHHKEDTVKSHHHKTKRKHKHHHHHYSHKD